MIVTILLAAVVVVALAAMPRRSSMAGDAAISDSTVVRYDLAIAVVLAVLLIAAGVVAAAVRASGAVVLVGQVMAVLAAAVSGGYAVRVVLALGGIPTRSENYDDPETEPLLRGGRVIGALERIAVAISLLLAWPAGIAVILGIKGLARFPQLREHHASEQFILGTFASVLWACAAAGVGWLLGHR